MARVSNWTKFKLLLWKNWQLQANHKLQLILEILLPSVFILILVGIRQAVVPESHPAVFFDPVDIDNLNLMRNALLKQFTSEGQIRWRTPNTLKNLNNAQKANLMPKWMLLYSPPNPLLEELIKEAVRLLELQGYQSYSNAQSLEDELLTANYFAGVEFDQSYKNMKAYPNKLSFSLRFPGELRTSFHEASYSWRTSRFFPLVSGNYPRNFNASDGGHPVGYLREGFLPLQNALSIAFIKLASGNNEDLPKIQLQRFPYPPFVFDSLLEGLQGVVSLVLVLCYIYPCTFITKYVAHEKEKQLKEIMKIMGLPNWLHWAAWFVKAFCILFLATVLIVIIMKVKWTNDVALLTNCSWTALFFFLSVYIAVSITFCFMLSVFFSRASTAAAVTGLVWFICYIPFMFIYQAYDSVSYNQKLAWCLISNTALGFGIKIILGLEGTGEGFRWSNLFTPVNVDDNLPIGVVIIMMLVSGFIYMSICLYVEQVFPGDFGVARKWYFLFTRSFWLGERRYSAKRNTMEGDSMERRNKDAFEVEPRGKFIGVKIINLKKKFGDKWAVKGLTLNMYEDEITVLLGHNGAGKTTTISMLTGMFSPTSGTAVINGYDISTDTDDARASMGICPQHNVLFNDMSVANHIRFFCKLKGLKGEEITREIKKYLKLIDIEKKANVASSKLSGGMQRKLSVCCALCGGTKVVLCDEPSSGMDPAARRHMWNLLQSEKAGRTLLLTTHFMDEADVLGDRIAIMCDGELKCYGTSLFLKKKFGSGYRLVCIKLENCNVGQVTILLRKYIPDIVPASDLGAELSYQLPYQYSTIFEQMLAELEENSERLGIDGYGISITSMEEVFLKVGAEKFIEIPTPYDFYLDDDTESIHSNVSFGYSTGHTYRPNQLLNQLRAMFIKKILYTWRKKFLLIIQLLIPIYFVVMAVLIMRGGLFEELPKLPIGLDDYKSAITLLEINPNVQDGSFEANLANEYTKYAKSFGKAYEVESTKGRKMADYVYEMSEKNQVSVNSRYLVAATIEQGLVTAWLNNQPLHTAPLTVNMVHNSMAKVRIGPNANIQVINKPLPLSADSRVQNIEAGQSLGGQLATNIAFCMAFVSAMFVLFLIKERESRSKLLQFVGGVRVWIFWLTHLVWDIFLYFLTTVVLIATLACFQEEYFQTFKELMPYFFLCIVFGFAALPLTYLLSSYFSEPATGFAHISTINIFLGLALYVTVLVLSMPGFKTKELADNLMWLFMIYPHFSIAMGINELYMNSVTTDLCSPEQIASMDPEVRCKLVPVCCEQVGLFAWERPGIFSEIFYMSCVGSICALIVIGREYRIIRDTVIDCKRRLKRRPVPPKNTKVDTDVITERRHIKNMTKKQVALHNLLLFRVTKYYGHFLAVNKLSFAVKSGECFGLLGVNGAGKTTTFKMLTGDEKFSYGKAFVRGLSILKQMNAVYREIGYCPQFDALLDDLTGRETLRIYCLLRGIPKRRIRYLTEELAKAFGFMKHLDKTVHKYSGGNKRKLSTAIAVLGDPAVIYLDEPTTGMDPGARRRLWNVVCMVRDRGKAIVLTSHSMEECEALCTRLAIMVNGELMCIGSIQHLKNKFSKGFILKIKIRALPESGHQSYKLARKSDKTKTQENQGADAAEASDTDESLDEVQITNLYQLSSQIRRDYATKIESYVEKEFPTAVQQQYYEGLITFYIPVAGVKWSELFGFMEKYREELNVEDYAITQTTLEEIFLDFAKQQTDGRTHSRKKGCCAVWKAK